MLCPVEGIYYWDGGRREGLQGYNNMMIYHFDNIGPTKFQIRITIEENGIWTGREDTYTYGKSRKVFVDAKRMESGMEYSYSISLIEK